MRKKKTKGDLSVQAIAGTHVVLLGMDFPEQNCPGLLGFALRREDHTEGEKYWLSGYKTFKSVEPFGPPLDWYVNSITTRWRPEIDPARLVSPFLLRHIDVVATAPRDGRETRVVPSCLNPRAVPATTVV